MHCGRRDGRDAADWQSGVGTTGRVCATGANVNGVTACKSGPLRSLMLVSRVIRHAIVVNHWIAVHIVVQILDGEIHGTTNSVLSIAGAMRIVNSSVKGRDGDTRMTVACSTS